ncbi:MAG TPA: TetR/AcrR family transcriptional regulator [Conexibacter sp.]|nr:TetR/AcrR family transcriptional regulator [Conexibacter sp.]
MPAAAPPTRPALRARYDRKQREVVATAARLFAQRGYQATSMQDLTEATGLAAGGLYHYIGSKERLLFLICDELLEPLLERARAIVAREAPAELHLHELLRAWLAHVATHRDHMAVFAQERHAIEREPRWRDVRRQRKAFEKILDDVLARGEQDGTMAFADRRLTLLALLGMVNHTATWLKPRGRLSPEQIADGYCDLLLKAGAPA